MSEIIHNAVLITACLAWVLAQCSKLSPSLPVPALAAVSFMILLRQVSMLA